MSKTSNENTTDSNVLKVSNLKLIKTIRKDYFVKTIKKVVATALVFTTILAGVSTLNYFADRSPLTTKASPAIGSTSSNGGNITIDKTYINGATENDNLSVNGGDTVTVRLKYDNTGNQTVTAANIKDSLPAGFTYVPGSTKNCLVPTTAESVCDSGNATQKNSMFTALSGTNGVSPTAGLYDATDTGAAGTDYGASAGLLEIGKKRYLNLNQCYYAASYSFTEWNSNPPLTGFTAGTNISNTQQTSISCGGGQGGYGYNQESSGLQGLDLQNAKYFNLGQCIYSNGNDYYTAIIDNVTYAPYNTGTKTSNNTQPSVNCGVGYTTYNYLPQSSLSGIKNLQILGNRYINLAHCGYSSGANNTVTAVDTTSESLLNANTSVSNSPTTLNCGAGKPGSTYQPSTSSMQNLDLLDTARGKGYIEYQMTAPATPGTFGTDTTLAGTDNVGAKTASDIGTANQVTVNGTVPNTPSPLTVTINQKSTQTDPTNNRDTIFTAVFSEPIDTTSFTTSDVSTVGSTATGNTVTSLTQVTPNNGTTFEITIRAGSAGTIIASIPAGSYTRSLGIFTGGQYDSQTSIYPRSTYLATDNLGNLYTVLDNGNISKTTPAGGSSSFGSFGYLDVPTAIAFDSSDNLYVINTNSNNITKITQAFVVSTFATLTSQPIAIKVDNNDIVYTSNTGQSTVTQITPAGAITSIPGPYTDSPKNVDAEGNIFNFNGNSGISMTTPSGVTTQFTTSSFNTSQYPNSVIVADKFGNVFTNYNGDSQYIYSTNGYYYTYIQRIFKLTKTLSPGIISTTQKINSLSTSTDNIITILPNNNPIANNDTFSILKDTNLSDIYQSNYLNILANDTDADGNNTITLKNGLNTTYTDPIDAYNLPGAYTQPLHGTIYGIGLGNNAKIIYLPNAGYIGTDSFTYTITDNVVGSLTSTATVNISVIAALPPPPSAAVINQTSTTQAGTTFTKTFTVVFPYPIDTSTFTISDVDISTSTAPGAIVNSITQVAPNDGTVFEVSISSSGLGSIIFILNSGAYLYSDPLLNQSIGFTSQPSTSVCKPLYPASALTSIPTGTPGFTIVNDYNPYPAGYHKREGLNTCQDIVLNKQPTSNVVINVSRILDTYFNQSPAYSLDSVIDVTTPTITFTPANWNVPQTVSVDMTEDSNTKNEVDVIKLSINQALSDDAFDSLYQNPH